MGWNSANEIFDPVAREVLQSRIDYHDTVRVLGALIKALQDGDWDTEDESLEDFRGYPAIVEAFRQNGVVPYDEAVGQ